MPLKKVKNIIQPTASFQVMRKTLYHCLICFSPKWACEDILVPAYAFDGFLREPPHLRVDECTDLIQGLVELAGESALHPPPYLFCWVKFGGVRGYEEQADVAGHFQLCRFMERPVVEQYDLELVRVFF